MIDSFNEFINERKIELLLEANMKIQLELIDVLSSIKSPIAKELISLNGKEVNVNTNYITYDINKDDKVLFKPDDKVEKIKYTFLYTGFYDILYSFTFHFKDFKNIERVARITNGDTIECELMDKELLLKSLETFKLANYINKEYYINLFTYKNIYLAKTEKNDVIGYSLLEDSNMSRNLSSVKNSEIAVGRFTRALLKKAGIDFNDKEIEKFVTEFKTAMRIKRDSFKNFSEVKGDEIIHWYNRKNNTDGGSLGSSCMKYNRCKYYFEIYTENPDQVSLIIMKSDDPEKISGRALLWTDIEGRKFMDRIYISDSSHEELFIEYAISKGYYYKQEQSFDNATVMYNRQELDIIIEVKLDEHEFDHYPYIDTLKYLKDDTLSSDENKSYDFRLTSTDGSNGECEYCSGSGEVTCSYCEGEGEVECSNCEGAGTESCEDCHGDGKQKCDDCEGSGTIENSEGEDEECPGCDGDGENDCDSCNGNGEQGCSVCDGDCNIRCNYCDGDGTVGCEEC